MSSVTANILRKGIAKGNSNLLSEIELSELESLILKNINSSSKKDEVFKNIVGIDRRIDQLIEKILNNLEIKKTLGKLLGEDYLLRHISVRYNEPNDKGLPMHQDSFGELSLTVLLNNQQKGSTFFFPGSQLLPTNRNLAQKVSWGSIKLINLTKYFLFTADGDAGSYYYFLNRTWHGRLPGKSNKTNISLFFAFFPVSAQRKDLISDDLEYNLKIENKLIMQPTLKKILSRQNYKIAIENYQKNKEHSLSMKVNNLKNIFKNIFYFMSLIIKLLFLEIIFSPISIKRFLKL